MTNPTVLAVPSVDDLQRVLTNALLAADSGKKHPPLASVQIEVRGGKVEIVTTDSYRLMHQEPGWDVTGAEGKYLVQRDALAPVLALCKAAKHQDRAAPVTVTCGEVIRLAGGIAYEVPLYPVNFPNWRQLVPTGNPLFPTALIPVAPKHLADLAKYRSRDEKVGEHTLKISAYESKGSEKAVKPLIITLDADAYCLQMPARVK